ncbi:hypothetical protein L3Q82_022527, partial [Scortum barcoo]
WLDYLSNTILRLGPRQKRRATTMADSLCLERVTPPTVEGHKGNIAVSPPKFPEEHIGADLSAQMGVCDRATWGFTDLLYMSAAHYGPQLAQACTTDLSCVHNKLTPYDPGRGHSRSRQTGSLSGSCKRSPGHHSKTLARVSEVGLSSSSILKQAPLTPPATECPLEIAGAEHVGSMDCCVHSHTETACTLKAQRLPDDGVTETSAMEVQMVALGTLYPVEAEKYDFNLRPAGPAWRMEGGPSVPSPATWLPRGEGGVEGGGAEEAEYCHNISCHAEYLITSPECGWVLKDFTKIDFRVYFDPHVSKCESTAVSGDGLGKHDY